MKAIPKLSQMTFKEIMDLHRWAEVEIKEFKKFQQILMKELDDRDKKKKKI